MQPRSMDGIERRASRITRHESRLFPRRAVVPSPEATAARITVFMVFPKHETRDTCLPTRQANHGFPAFGTEALQSCFGRPGRPSMTTGRLDRLAVAPGSAYEGKILARIASLPCEEKSGGKNRGGDITPMRLRRSLFFVAPATPAGRPSRRQPGETVQALSGRPGRAGCGLPGAPDLPKAAFLTTWGSEVRAGHETRNTKHESRPLRPFSSPWVRKGRTTKNRLPDRRTRRQVTACLPGIGRNWTELDGIARGVGGGGG